MFLVFTLFLTYTSCYYGYKEMARRLFKMRVALKLLSGLCVYKDECT